MSSLIIIEGLIGAGKSTLTKQLSDTLGAIAMYEPVEENPYLEKFYQDPKRYALEMQFWLMSNRYQMHREAIEIIWRTGKPVIMDRSIYGDAVFCKRNYLDGNIDELGYKNYMAMRKVMTNSLLVPQLSIYLQVDPNECNKRISSRGRDCEQTIPVKYLEGLEVLYRELMVELEEMGSNVVNIDWNEFKDPELVMLLIKNRLPQAGLLTNYKPIGKR